MSRPRILIVDDDPMTLDLLSKLLHSHMPDAVVEMVGSSIDALEQLRGHAYDLLVTDLRLPEITGAALAQYLYEINPFVPVVLMSAARLPSSLPPNVFAHLSKPLDRECFRGIVSRALHYHRLRQPSIPGSFAPLLGGTIWT